MNHRLLLVLCFLVFPFIGVAQVFYGYAGGFLFSFSYVNGSCASCPLQQLNGIASYNQNFNGDLFVLPNGDIIITQGDQLLVYELPNPDPVVNISGLFVTGTAAGPGGLVYLIGQSGNNSSLYTYDPVTNAVTLIGSFPAGNTLTDLFYFNGQLYASGNSVFLVNTSDPAASVLQNASIPPDVAVADEGFYIGLNFGSPVFGQVNPVNGSSTILCNLTPPVPGGSLQQVPAGAQQPPSCCTTEAGTLPGVGPFNICINTPLSFPPAAGVVLDNNDLLRYILFSDPNDPAGSVVATSSTPFFAFNPATMQPGITYYIAAIAGNGLNGSVDFNDPCFDISNLGEVIWRPLPTVAFSVANPDVCAGACTTVTVTFTGTAPFTLTYTTPGGGPATQSFSSNTGTFQVCVPAGAPVGGFSVQATTLVDAWCTCQ
jgi:hypothetical protein